ncbi:unnamed protein product [Closterium sp. Yama58-4]|nr:unnamed protein product [Closterium sp. Yama58-4]
MTYLRGSGGSGGDGGGNSGSGGGSRSGSRGGVVQWGVSGGGQMQLRQLPRVTLTSQQLREWYAQRCASRSTARCPYVICTVFGDEAELPRWLELLRDKVDIFALDYAAIFTAMYALTAGTEGDCYLCVPPDPGIEAAALVLARSSTVLPCPAVPSGSLSGLHLPSFSTNLVSNAVLQDAGVDTFTPGGQRVAICTCSRTGRHLATFTRRPGSSLYTLTTAPPHFAASAQVSASCSCRLLSHQTLLWHHCLGHPSLPRLRGTHSRLLVSGLPRSLPPLPASPAPPCIPCVEGRQRAASHSSFPPTTAPLQTLHMDVWGPARINGLGRERYFQLVVDDYSRYTMVFPLRSKGEVPDILIPRIRAVRLQLRERFRTDLPVLCLHSDRGVMEVARTSMIHAAAPHFLWPFAVRYAAHQLNLWPRVSLPETSPTLLWTGKVGDASVFWFSFYHPTSRRVLPSQDVTFDESVPFYRLFPYRSAPLPPPPLFLAPGPPPVDPLPPQGPAPSSVSQVDPLPLAEPVEVTGDSGAAGGGATRGAASGGAEPERAEPGGAEPERAEPGGAEPERAEPGGAEPVRAEPEGTAPGGAARGAEPGGAEPGDAASSDSPSVALLELEAKELHALALEVLELEALELGALALEALELETLELEVLELEALELEALELEALPLEVLELEVLVVLGLLVLAALLEALWSLSPHSSCASGSLGAPAFGVALLQLATLELETLGLEALALEALELEVLELEALALEAIELEALDLETLELNALALEALELEVLALEALELEALELETLELEALELEVLELEALELETLELEALEPEVLALEALRLETLALEALELVALELELVALETLELEVLVMETLEPVALELEVLEALELLETLELVVLELEVLVLETLEQEVLVLGALCNNTRFSCRCRICLTYRLSRP